MHSEPRGFSDIDHIDEPQAYIDYLDGVNQLQQFQAYKRQSYQWLALQTGQSILDVGCGTGLDAHLLAPYVGADGQVIGIDRSHTVLRTAMETEYEVGVAPSQETLDPSVIYCQADIHQLPFSEESFDAVRADRVLQHVEQPMNALLEMKRVSRPGGRVVVIEPDWEALLVDVPNRALTRRVTQYHCDRLVRHGWVGRGLFRLFQQAGYTEIRITPVTLVFTDFTLARHAVDLQMIVQTMVEEALIDMEAAENWLHDLQHASRQSTFFMSITGFMIGARKPS